MLKRLFRHLTTTSATGQRHFPTATLSAIQREIAAGEKMHRAEIRLMVEPSMPLWDVLGGVTPRQQARRLFSEYRVWDTEENVGMLIYFCIADRDVEIIADRTINKHIKASDWQQICNVMTEGFAAGKYQESVLAALDQLNRLLQNSLPADDNSKNELSNRPLIL